MPKQTYEEWKATLSPEQESAREASNEFADQEMMFDVMRRIKDEDNHFSGPYGLLPYLGYNRGEGATYRNVGGGKSGRSKVATSDSRTLGLYQQEDDDDGLGYDLFSQLLEQQGLDPMAPGELAFNMLYHRDSPEREAETLFHELAHRALDPSSELGKDFLSYIDKNEDIPESKKWSLKSAFEGYTRQEAIADTYSPGSTTQTEGDRQLYQGKISDLTEELQTFLTPEKQKEHGVRLPVPATKPQEEKTKSWWSR